MSAVKDFPALAERAFRDLARNLPSPLGHNDAVLAIFKSGFLLGTKEGARAVAGLMREGIELLEFQLMDDVAKTSEKEN